MQVVEPKLLSLEELAAYDGTDQAKPIYLAVRGVVFNVTQGRDFYGPDGAYPFGGRECARALAKYSVEIEDCNEDLEGCGLAELDALRDWEARFHSKYPVVGKTLGKKKA
jgi:membrane-associated progesterone receptor component